MGARGRHLPVGEAAVRTTITAACLIDQTTEWDHLREVLSPLAADAMSFPHHQADGTHECSVLGWARSGLAHLTGWPDGPPLAPPGPVLARAAILADAIAGLTALTGRTVRLDPAHLLTHRARLRGWQRHGTTSVNGSCRILQAADAWLAVNLARPEDIGSVPAVLGRMPDSDVWAELATDVASRPAAEVVAAAQLVGIPAAVLGDLPPAPVRMRRVGFPDRHQPRLVLDLSAMWAGPLCAQLLRQAGWRVLKVEDSRRPDGARSGPPAFYAELHAGIPAVRLDFGARQGTAELGRLAAQASVVLESSRPRALSRLGLVAEDWLASRPGRTWISITGYGRADPAQRVAFGDDAAVAGGLVAWAADGSPVFCGDAIADPLTGMMAALAGLAAQADGGGWLVDVAMAGVCADLARAGTRERAHTLAAAGKNWTIGHGALTEDVRTW